MRVGEEVGEEGELGEVEVEVAQHPLERGIGDFDVGELEARGVFPELLRDGIVAEQRLEHGCALLVSAIGYCLGIFAASTTRLQRFDSLWKNARSSAGVLARPSTPSSAKRFSTSGPASTFATSRWIRSITAAGVLPRAPSPFHHPTPYPA